MTRVPMGPGRAENSGFTLIEVLTALAVMGVAISIFFGLFAASLSLGKSSRAERVAAQLAEEYLTDVQANPGRYRWPDYADGQSGELLRVTLAGIEDAPVHQADPPTVMPTYRRAHDRERSFYHDFTWEAFARLPSEGANYVDLILVIRWLHEGHERLFALTTCMPRSVGEGAL